MLAFQCKGISGIGQMLNDYSGIGMVFTCTADLYGVGETQVVHIDSFIATDLALSITNLCSS